jgi:hypothetical protein
MTTTIQTRARRLSAGLLMSSAVALVLFGQPARAAPQDWEINAFSSSRYNYCDARILGEFYGRDAYGGKILIGTKIRNGIGTNVPVILDEARTAGYACEWADTGYSYQDAQVLASVWGYDEIYEAKLRAAELFTWGDARQVELALGV